MGEVSLETSPENIMIQDMINSENSMNTTESTNTTIFKITVYNEKTVFCKARNHVYCEMRKTVIFKVRKL